MLLLFTILPALIKSKDFYICIYAPGNQYDDCGDWPPNGAPIDLLLENKTDFSSLLLHAGDYVYLGVGNVPNLPIDLGTLTTSSHVINMIINTTNPDNNTIMFDFQVSQFDDLSALTFNSLQLKPYNRSIVHTTSTTHSYVLIFNNCNFLDGYTFESDIFRPLQSFRFSDVTIVEKYDIWQGSIHHTPVLENFLFSENTTLVYPTKNRTDATDITFTHSKMTGEVTLITDYFEHPNFILKSPFDEPDFGFIYIAPVKEVTFSGGWGENTTLGEGIRILMTKGNFLTIICGERDFILPLSAQMQNPSDQFNVIVKGVEERIELSPMWNISCPSIFTRNDKSKELYIYQMRFLTPQACVYRADITKKKFFVNDVIIKDNITYYFPGKNDFYLRRNFIVRPNTIVYVDGKINFDKNTAVMELVWDSHLGWPYVEVLQPEFGTSKTFPKIALSDYEPIERIADANNTYADIIGVPHKLVCGNGMLPFEKSKFMFMSLNPSFLDNGVWDYYWETNNETGYTCLVVNMTDFPEVPIIPVPTQSKDPAAVDRNAMIGMIVTFVFLFIAAILGYFSKYLPSNRRDRAKELAEKRGSIEPETDSDQTDATKAMSESELSFRDLNFDPDLSEYSLDTTMDTHRENAYARYDEMSNSSYDIDDYGHYSESQSQSQSSISRQSKMNKSARSFRSNPNYSEDSMSQSKKLPEEDGGTPAEPTATGKLDLLQVPLVDPRERKKEAVEQAKEAERQRKKHKKSKKKMQP
ncbi:hypothetical protein TRFO_35342 [Tritrichomonas foetus]|uniref:Uncharacterized protein n=1 Tax=Tritrichomonas foetus TaxID=1144522 RepID=A0A1J4JLX5_9EUKA|nr:hypothetical protein TRFO_35342 [Tritrichomonas foetus]|eukprot:OHS98276.1 hypothetical protein TRFO_35342 [Tritrichomonas foetus]